MEPRGPETPVPAIARALRMRCCPEGEYIVNVGRISMPSKQNVVLLSSCYCSLNVMTRFFKFAVLSFKLLAV